MKPGTNPFLLCVLAAGFGALLASQVAAQTFTTLHEFAPRTNNGSGQYTNSDGAIPLGGLLLSDKTLYGTAAGGGDSELGSVFTGVGTVFKVNMDTTGFTTLHHCAYRTNGAIPSAGLVLSGNTLYGTTLEGGLAMYGDVFSIGTDGTGYKELHTFTWMDGAAPQGRLVLSGTRLYGTTQMGGPLTNGAVFAINTDGTGFTNLHYFGPPVVLGDGLSPSGGLILSSGTLYGTTQDGGTSNGGTVFALSTDGTGYTNLHNFTHSAMPRGGLVLVGDTLYGTTSDGGDHGNGTVFKVNTDGTGFTTLYVFGMMDFKPVPPYYTNSDGANPSASLVASGNTLYGTARAGGLSGYGTVFALNTDGTGFLVLHSFTGGADGGAPSAELVLSEGTLYGTSSGDGTGRSGTIFSISLPSLGPQLTDFLSGTNVILSWPNNATVFILESTTNFASPAWTTNCPAPVVVNGQNTVTNSIGGAQQFFRLRK